MTAAAWLVEANNMSYRTDGTYSDGSVPSYGVRLLVLAAEWSPQAFLGGRRATDCGGCGLLLQQSIEAVMPPAT